MSRFTVTYTHPDWRTLALDPSQIGLGEPFLNVANSPYEILISEDTLRLRRGELVTERDRWSNFSKPSSTIGPVANPSYELRTQYSITEGDSPRARFRRLFSRRLYDILFPLRSSTKTQIADYWETVPALGPLGEFEDNKHILDILSNYITLIDRILASTIGLSRREATSQTVPSTLVPTARITKQVPLDFVSIRLTDIPLLETLTAALTSLVNTKTQNFFDPTRELKTFLNFGDHIQYVLTSWRPTTDESTIQVKTSVPVDSIQIFDPVLISRDIASSIVDSLVVELPPVVDLTPRLRPPNFNINASTTAGTVVEASLASLGLLTGSVGMVSPQTISYEDSTFNRWYTADFNSSELNVDFTDYRNFVYYGSALTRLDAFVNKIKSIESLDVRFVLSSSIDSERNKAIQVETIKRNFDQYEQFLYFDTSSVPYSASLYTDDDYVEYNSTASWPKQGNGIIYPSTSSQATEWYATQRLIAIRFDEQNENFLVKHLPSHIQEDASSTEFLAFVAMFGHVMDNVKVYVDHFPNIYSTDVDPLTGLTMDQVYEVATSFGLNLPNPYQIESLDRFVQGNLPSSLRVSLAETWKRLLHNVILLYKTKGTRESVHSILNAYGINSPLVQIKESAYPSSTNYVQSDEVVYGLLLSGSGQQFVTSPFVSGTVNTETIQLRFKPSVVSTGSILTGDVNWAINLEPYTNDTSTIYGRLENYVNGTYQITQNKANYGRITVTSGSPSTMVASSSYFPLYTEDFTTVMLRRTGMDMTVTQTDGDQILFTETVPSSLDSVWDTTQFVSIGGSGSMKLSSPVQGVVDEVRLWSEYIDDDTYVKHVYDPGAAFGATYTSSFATLLVDLTFSQPLTAITASATNETPNPIGQTFTLPATGFSTASYQKFVRQTKQFVPQAGSIVYADNKVLVADPIAVSPTMLDQNGVVKLSRTNSIKPLSEKKYTGPQDQVIFAVSPLDYVEQNIRRTMGPVDVNYLIGSPRKILNGKYPELEELFRFYVEKYAAQVSPNEYTRFMANAVAAPTEQVEATVPVRVKLLDGVVIESPSLHRQKENIIRTIAVDGTNTNANLTFESASAAGTTASAHVGAHDFTATYDLYPVRDYMTIPQTQIVHQYINDSTLVTSSLVSKNSGIAYIESTISAAERDVYGSYNYYTSSIQFTQPTYTDTGYPRKAYEGVPTVLDSEINTLIPFYDIPPAADFLDVGTTTYFHKESGVYRLPSFISRYKTEFYKVEFAVKLTSALDQLYAPLTLLPPDTIDFVGRETATLTLQLTSGSSETQTIRLARVFLLMGIEAPAGLDITLTRRSDNTIVFSGVTDGSSDIFPYVPIQAGDDGLLVCTISNITGGSVDTNIVLSYFTLQGLPLTPSGYLPRHYRFFKNTSVAQKRRNADGCKIIFCPEGCPDGVVETDPVNPVEVTPSQPTSFTINRPLREADTTTITFGGQGPLDP